MQMTLLVLLVPIALLLGAAATAWFLRSRTRQDGELKNQIAQWVQEHLRNSNEQFLQLASERLGHEQTKGQAAFSQNTQQIENALKQMSVTMDTYSRLVRDFEKERTAQYGNLQARMENEAKVTGKLQQTTDRLTSILGNVKLRGQWGERMAEDILRVSGLMEHVHYRRNRTQETSQSRPDYVFLLPNDWKVCMDVKFPLDNYLALVNSETAEGRDSFQAEFIRDVKDRIKEIVRRDYINADEQTLDCVILFIPNEQVFGFIQEAAPGLLDEAMRQKVILCSPFTLYAVLAIVRQSFEDFHFKQKAQEILGMIVGFQKDFETFKKRFEDLGSLLQKASAKYQEITDVSYKRLDGKISKIEEYRKGSTLGTIPSVELAPHPAAEQVPALPVAGSPTGS